MITSPSTQADRTIPGWLSIVRLDDRHFQLTDTSVASIGLCLGVFSNREAAELLAAKIARTRAASSPSLRSTHSGSNAGHPLAAVSSTLRELRSTLSPLTGAPQTSV